MVSDGLGLCSRNVTKNAQSTIVSATYSFICRCPALKEEATAYLSNATQIAHRSLEYRLFIENVPSSGFPGETPFIQ